MPRNYQTLADYAAIGIAPLLIWWMLNSLANFLMIVIYHGNYPGNVSWILMCYTMGATAIARVTIEESRERASVYAVALGGATFYVMTRFLHDPVFSLAVILTIGYLADRIVHDCTIIDDGVDSSGQGLVDSARKWFQNRSPHLRTDEASPSGWQPRSQKQAGHQPGRTVLYLAVGALPLFGIGQFFLNNSPGSWDRAKWLLTLYLFTSLSLLVVTSFLNLRRYLRQRSTEMPLQVTVAWLAGGIGMILFILLIAFLAPMPGQTLISWRMPDFLSDSKSMTASRWGWGKDGADHADQEAPGTGEPRTGAQKPEGAPQVSSQNQPDAKPGGETGDRPDGPAGKESGGNKPASQSPQPAKSGKPDQPSKSNDPDKSTKSQQPPSPDKPSNPTPSDANQKLENQEQKLAGTNQPTPAKPPQSPEPQDQQPEAKPDQSQPNETKPTEAKPTEAKPSEAKPSEIKSSETKAAPSKSAEPKSAESMPPPQPSANLGGAIAGLFQFVLVAGLLAVVAVYVYLYREAWLAWLQGWLTGRDSIDPVTRTPSSQKLNEPPARPFSSFINPVGTAEAGQVVVVTFQALEAWGREQGVRRGDDETPSEYVRRLVAQFPTLKQPAWRVVDAYNRVVYGRTSANRADVTAASSVWQIMRPQL